MKVGDLRCQLAEKGTLQREVDEVRSQLTDSLAGLEASRAQLDASEAEKRTLQMKVVDLRCQLAEKGTLQREVDEVRCQLTDSLAGLEASRAQLDASEAEKRTLQMKVGDL